MSTLLSELQSKQQHRAQEKWGTDNFPEFQVANQSLHHSSPATTPLFCSPVVTLTVCLQESIIQKGQEQLSRN